MVDGVGHQIIEIGSSGSMERTMEGQVEREKPHEISIGIGSPICGSALAQPGK